MVYDTVASYTIASALSCSDYGLVGLAMVIFACWEWNAMQGKGEGLYNETNQCIDIYYH